MRILLALLLFASLGIKAQSDLEFNKRLIDCEDKWVALPIKKDSTFTYGFVYLDNTAGLTIEIEGTFKMGSDNTFLPKKMSTTSSFKQRISPTNVLVAIIPESKLAELNVIKTPTWLSIYKSAGDNSPARLFRLGFVNNQWNEVNRALIYLEQVEKIDPNYRGLNLEFAFSYNALKQYDKAITYIDKALKENPRACNLYRELVYAQCNLRLVDAEQTFKKSLEICQDRKIKTEMAYNISHKYYLAKDKANFNIWATEAKKWATVGDNFYQNIEKMQVQLDKL